MAPSDFAAATADLLRAVYGPVAANAGTFEVSGNTLTLRPTVAKNTFPMVPGFFNEYEFTLDGDTLVTTWTRSSYGPISNPLITRLTRAR